MVMMALKVGSVMKWRGDERRFDDVPPSPWVIWFLVAALVVVLVVVVVAIVGRLA